MRPTRVVPHIDKNKREKKHKIVWKEMGSATWRHCADIVHRTNIKISKMITQKGTSHEIRDKKIGLTHPLLEARKNDNKQRRL